MDRQRAGSPGPRERIVELAREWVETSCAAQDLPVKVTEASVLSSVATLLALVRTPAVDNRRAA
jgi:hypothetical protein